MRLPLRIRVALLLCACPSAYPFSAQSKHATKYYAMIDRFAEHSRSDIESIESPRFREMLCSVQEAIHDTKVVNAFGILYEDIAPVRFAGDLIFSKLDSAVFKAAESKGSREAPDAALEALRADDLAQVRRAHEEGLRGVRTHSNEAALREDVCPPLPAGPEDRRRHADQWYADQKRCGRGRLGRRHESCPAHARLAAEVDRRLEAQSRN